MTLAELGYGIWRALGRAIGGPRAVLQRARIATLSVAEICLELVQSGLVPDIHRLKEAYLSKAEAEADAAKADARKRMAEAVDAANHSIKSKQQQAAVDAEIRQKNAQASKTEAEAKAILMDAHGRLIEKISRLKQEGGDAFFNSENLIRLLSLAPPTSPQNDPDDRPSRGMM